jgi:threonine/homoserine/homoserine lactone efflux protein
VELSLLTFAFLALVVVMTPGPTVLLALSNGSRFGIILAGYGIAGAAVSDAFLITAAGLGLGAILATSATLFNVVKWAGVAYLIWMGFQMLRSSAEPGVEIGLRHDQQHETRSQKGAIFRKSFLAAVTNPKGYLFFSAFLPQFVTPTDPMLLQYVMLAVVFILIDVATMTLYAALGGKAVKFLNGRGAFWIDRVCGGLLVALGLGLALIIRGEA